MTRAVEEIETASTTESSGAWLALSMGVSGKTRRAGVCYINRQTWQVGVSNTYIVPRMVPSPDLETAEAQRFGKR